MQEVHSIERLVPLRVGQVLVVPTGQVFNSFHAANSYMSGVLRVSAAYNFVLKIVLRQVFHFRSEIKNSIRVGKCSREQVPYARRSTGNFFFNQD